MSETHFQLKKCSSSQSSRSMPTMAAGMQATITFPQRFSVSGFQTIFVPPFERTVSSGQIVFQYKRTTARIAPS